MSSDMGSNNLFDPMSNKLIEPGIGHNRPIPCRTNPLNQVCSTWHRTELSDPLSDKPVGQACPTQHRTIVSDAVSDKPTGWVYFSGVDFSPNALFRWELDLRRFSLQCLFGAFCVPRPQNWN
ncbi:hypothetical protein PCASD_12804 [Puccinia coronata f. sp. avenae]|uniref:Uncharacterized protein n=1 Tax=Puccinia coronata f. sp. avenae TaxID=200324 RepID=A0A2N5UVY1_9BASI|nr:hypothetical protein PCASD_12804 [Puccinia coronata f. sp. avenae]